MQLQTMILCYKLFDDYEKQFSCIYVTNQFVMHGNPYSLRFSSVRDLSTLSASLVRAGSNLSSGTITQIIPAALAACTPLAASSNTMTFKGDLGGDENRLAAAKYMSGAGLPFSTRGSSEQTMCDINLNNS